MILHWTSVNIRFTIKSQDVDTKVQCGKGGAGSSSPSFYSPSALFLLIQQNIFNNGSTNKGCYLKGRAKPSLVMSNLRGKITDSAGHDQERAGCPVRIMR